MSELQKIFAQWEDVRNGLIKEVELVPADQFGFRATPETRTVLELAQHIIETERMLAGEVCRENTNFARGFPAIAAEFAGNVKQAQTKEDIISLLGTSFEESKAKSLEFGDENIAKMMTRFDGRQAPKAEMLRFAVAHEMYHRGQFTVYQRLLGIEPALTTFFKKTFASTSK